MGENEERRFFALKHKKARCNGSTTYYYIPKRIEMIPLAGFCQPPIPDVLDAKRRGPYAIGSSHSACSSTGEITNSSIMNWVHHLIFSILEFRSKKARTPPSCYLS